MSGATIRVVVAEDHPVYRDGVVAALVDQGCDILAAVERGDDAIIAVTELEPDVVLLDLSMPGGGGIETIRTIRGARPSVAVLVLTMSDDDATVFAALGAGAAGYLLKEADADQIVQAVMTVASGGSVLGASVAGRVFEAATAPPSRRPTRAFPELTDREFDVLRHLARGHTNTSIASQLGLAEKTVRNIVSVVLAKLHVATRGEAGAAARDAGLGGSAS